ncbi:MAG: NAD(P)-dependent oxidoreductase [Flavobacteriales bacterium]|nr:NAD(P)-dependent oxidoreductase [Flavobacteriales bacterium]
MRANHEMRLLVTGGSGFIGTNLVEFYAGKGTTLLNLDWNPPMNPMHQRYWRQCDIMDAGRVEHALAEFAPTHVVHLAARTDTDELIDVDAYRQNHEGTRILLEAIKKSPSVVHVIVTSTQFVCEAGYQPKHDEDFKPFTVYGESKRLTEQVTRSAGLQCAWTLIRPTTIWGPWSLRYRDVMFKVMRKGFYFHPGRKRVVRSYGYVGNVVWQIDRMLTVPREAVAGKVFYVGDRPFDLKIWAEAVSLALTGKPVRYIPTWIVRSLAFLGDLLKALRIPFPITSGRYRSMTTDYITPMDRTIAVLGEAPFSMADGIRETIAWYDRESESIVAGARKDARTDSIPGA